MAALQTGVVNVDVLVLRHLFHKALQELILKLTLVRPKMNVLCSIVLVLKHFFNARRKKRIGVLAII